MRDSDQNEESEAEDDAGGAREDDGVPGLDEDHGEILRLLIGEGTEATLEMFHEAKAPDIDPILKLKLITLGSRLGDNVRKAIAIYARHFGGQGRTVAAHFRNIRPMNEAPRCGARTRAGTLCQSPAISGKARCRMHGGKKSGAPKGNRNALRHGVYTKEAIEREVRVRELCRRLRCLTLALTSMNESASAAEPSPSAKESGQ